MIKRIPASYSAGIILSYKCNASCLHCMYACSPKWRGNWISEKGLEHLLSILKDTIQPSPLGPDYIGVNHGIHFTGGEPFLNFKLLLRATEMASYFGIPSLFVETNCFWCKNKKTTREKLLALKEKGMKGILISVNPFYLEYVPFERTKTCVEVSREIFGVNTLVYQIEYYRRFSQFGITGTLAFEEFLKLERGKYFARNVEFFLMGRAPYKIAEKLSVIFPRFKASRFFFESCRPPFLRNWHNHFDNYGNFIPGYCGGIALGNWNNGRELFGREINTTEYPLLKYLMHEDMKGLFKYARTLGFKENGDGYFSKCHLCTDIRKYLSSSGNYGELKPEEFYLYLED